jgi:hypothetical protein
LLFVFSLNFLLFVFPLNFLLFCIFTELLECQFRDTIPLILENWISFSFLI